jgi:hypothetical protein
MTLFAWTVVKDQVARQRRLNRDLRGLGVADFADHDLVRVVTQNRPQAARKRQALLLVDRNLRDAASWYSTGSSIVMILSSIDLISTARHTASSSCRCRSAR